MVMWTCVGCTLSFHPTCVGVVAQRGSLRKKEKKIDPEAYVLPCCSTCQSQISLSFDIRTLTEQQAQLTEAINSNTEVTHRHQNNVLNNFNLSEGLESLETLLNELKTDLKTTVQNFNTTESHITNSSAILKELSLSRKADKLADDLTVKNHLTSLLNISMQTTKDNIAAYVEALTQDITRELKNICKDFEKVSSLTIDMANHCSEHKAQPAFTSDIIEELKTLSNASNTPGALLQAVCADYQIILAKEAPESYFRQGEVSNPSSACEQEETPVEPHQRSKISRRHDPKFASAVAQEVLSALNESPVVYAIQQGIKESYESTIVALEFHVRALTVDIQTLNKTVADLTVELINPSSLMGELQLADVDSQRKHDGLDASRLAGADTEDHSGWRIIGSKKIWRQDWSS